jgi:hypothetical protein
VKNLSEINYREIADKILKDDATGNLSEEYKETIYPFDKYEIKIKLTLDNKFVAITEIKINKNFLDYNQKKAKRGYHDVEEYYKD